MATTSRLFTYGTLRLPDVQQALFGRVIEGAPGTLPGFVRATITIVDEAVVGLSGTAEHLILRHTGDPADRIHGIVYTLTDAELCAADAYETDAYVRVPVTLASGDSAFVCAQPEDKR